MGVLGIVGDIMSAIGGYLEYDGGCSVPWGISWVAWGYSEPWGIHDAHGGYHEYHGDVRYCGGYYLLLFEYLHCTEQLPWYPWCPHVHHDIPHDNQITKDNIPHGTEYPPQYSWYPPCASWCPHSTENPPPYSRNPPMALKRSPVVFNIPPKYSRYPPYLSWYPPRYWKPLTALKISPNSVHDIFHGTEHPHGTEHTLYRVETDNDLMWKRVFVPNLPWQSVKFVYWLWRNKYPLVYSQTYQIWPWSFWFENGLWSYFLKWTFKTNY